MVSFTPWPPYPLRKSRHCSLNKMLEEAHNRSASFREDIHLLPTPGIEARYLCCPVSSPTESPTFHGADFKTLSPHDLLYLIFSKLSYVAQLKCKYVKRVIIHFKTLVLQHVSIFYRSSSGRIYIKQEV